MSYKVSVSCLKFSLVALFLLFLQPVFSQSNFSDLEESIAGKKAILSNDLIVMIANKDSVVYKKEYGDFNLKTQVPIASCSKWLTAALVMQLVDEGKISLDDKISQYLPIFESYRKGYITIRHCLSHQTGIQTEPITLKSILGRKKYESLEEEVNDFAKKEIQTNAGEAFRYSNIGLNIAARIVEIVTKKKFESIIKTKLFSPLGMKNTSFATDDGSAPNPSGGAKSTALDYTRFMQMLLNKGTFNGKQILSEASVEEMRKIQVPQSMIKYAPKAAEGFLYALGSWVLEGSDKVGEKATALSSPGLFGTWPMVDFSRGYTCIFLLKSFLGEQKADAYLDLKKVIDGHFAKK